MPPADGITVRSENHEDFFNTIGPEETFEARNWEVVLAWAPCVRRPTPWSFAGGGGLDQSPSTASAQRSTKSPLRNSSTACSCATGLSPATTVATITSQRLLKASDSTDFADGAPTALKRLGSFSMVGFEMRFKSQAGFDAYSTSRRGKGHLLVSPMPAAARAHHQLGFGSGGYTGTAGMKPFRFGISTFGRLFSSMTSVSPTMPFRYNRNAVSA